MNDQTGHAHLREFGLGLEVDHVASRSPVAADEATAARR